MSVALGLAFLWAVVAAAVALSSLRGQAPVCYALILTGIPILGLATWAHGPVAGSLLLAMGFVLLRYPLRPISRRVRRWIGGAQ